MKRSSAKLIFGIKKHQPEIFISVPSLFSRFFDNALNHPATNGAGEYCCNYIIIMKLSKTRRIPATQQCNFFLDTLNKNCTIFSLLNIQLCNYYVKSASRVLPPPSTCKLFFVYAQITKLNKQR